MQKEIEHLSEVTADPFNVRRSTAFVVNSATSVFINKENITPLSQILEENIQEKKLLTSNQFGNVENSPQLVFIQDTINFCFWANRGEDKWQVEYPHGRIVDGWDGLVACFDRAIDEDTPILDSNFLEQLTIKDTEHIFRSNNNTKIPLLEERAGFLRQAGTNLNIYYGGNAENLLKKANYDAVKIVKEIIDNFPTFADYSYFEGKEISFLKRAQICAYDLSLLPTTKIENINALTIFADYKLPQILRSFGVLRYKKNLATTVDTLTPLEKDSKEEIEIRSATIWTCELLAKQLQVAPPIVDNALWNLGHHTNRKMEPYHRVLTTNY